MSGSTIRQLQDLLVWQRSITLAVRVHQLTADVPVRFRYSLAEQMNRAAISIPSNIAEGYGRNGKGEFRRGVGIAPGSLRELETQLLLGGHLEAWKAADATEPLAMATEPGRMLARLSSRLR